jgi:diguanylate cyclase (GGDEF)-like protein
MECVRSQVPIAISMFKSYERTSYESEHDKLTGLYNRRYFEAIFSMIKNKALRYADRFTLVLFDINYLKRVNDSLGHLAGDALLLHFATEMKAWFRSSDIFARFGGDEFIALMFHADGEGGMERLEEQRRLLSERPVQFKGEILTCSFGYGIAVFNEDGTEYDDMVAVADKRMYADKAEFKERSLRGRESRP